LIACGIFTLQISLRFQLDRHKVRPVSCSSRKQAWFYALSGVFWRLIRDDSEQEQVAPLTSRTVERNPPVGRRSTGLSAGARFKLVFAMSDGKPALPVLNLTVVYRPTNSIKPESRNARTHSKKQIAEIAASIQQFGFANPLLIDVEGVLIAGHGRLLAAKSIGLDSAPTITLPHLDEAQRRALRLADNKIALNAGWDVDLLKLELKELADLERFRSFGHWVFNRRD
jgi:hypothetical protein